jgi:hypothetical protein
MRENVLVLSFVVLYNSTVKVLIKYVLNFTLKV